MKKNFRVVLLSLFILTVFSIVLTGASDSSTQWKWKIDDLITTERVAGFQISPDGSKLAWWTNTWNLKTQKSYNTLFISSLTGKDKPGKLQLTRGENKISRVQWVPGTDLISFKTDREFPDTKPQNLWLINVNGGEPYPVTSLENGIQVYEWIDKDNIVFVAKEEKTLLESETEEKKDTSEVVEDETHREITRIFKYNLKDKKTTRITSNVKPVENITISPNKEWLIYEMSMSLLYRQDHKIPPRFYLMNLKTGDTKEIFPGSTPLPSGSFAWAKDSSGFYIEVAHSTTPGLITVSINKYFWYPLATGKAIEVNLQWDRSGDSPITLTDGFVISLLDGVHFKYARFFKKNDTWERKWITTDIQKNIENIQVAEDGKTMIYKYSTASVPPRFYLAELKGDQFIKKYEVMDIESPLFKLPLTKSEVLTWKGAKDEIVEGILYYPFKYEQGKQYPLVLMIHGGPYAPDMNYFHEGYVRPDHLLAERGAFVLKVNYHGSSNYGLAFGESIKDHYYELETVDLENGIEMLISQGKVDKDKLGIMGWSNGAILGTHLITNSVRFNYKVASLGAGDVNWFSDYGNCAFGVSFDNFYFGGAPWEKTDVYLRISPLFKLHKVTTPTLIFHGSLDTSVPYEQGWEFYRALQVTGKAPVRFISFPGEGHGPQKLPHMRRKLSEDIRWFEMYLFNTYSPKNESLKKNSPLDNLDKYLTFGRVDGLYGFLSNNLLLPEMVKYKEKTIGRFEVTQAQWAVFDKTYKPEKGKENYPITGITFDQAQKYIQWLNQVTGQTYRLPTEDEIETFYSERSGNTFDFWADYKINPDDYKNLSTTLNKYQNKPVLLKPVGTFKGTGDEPVFDLDGNAAEWVSMKDGKGKACGGSAERPNDIQHEIPAKDIYTGFRVVLM